MERQQVNLSSIPQTPKRDGYSLNMRARRESSSEPMSQKGEQRFPNISFKYSMMKQWFMNPLMYINTIIWCRKLTFSSFRKDFWPGSVSSHPQVCLSHSSCLPEVLANWTSSPRSNHFCTSRFQWPQQSWLLCCRDCFCCPATDPSENQDWIGKHF